jgi:hypothetical protein
MNDGEKHAAGRMTLLIGVMLIPVLECRRCARRWRERADREVDPWVRRHLERDPGARRRWAEEREALERSCSGCSRGYRTASPFLFAGRRTR